MSQFSVVRPRDDQPASQAYDWCDGLIGALQSAGHSLSDDVDDTTPADATNIEAALRGGVPIIFYFGHGTEISWETSGQTTIDASNVSAGSGASVVSVACKTGRHLGPDAVTAGLTVWLGFTVKVPVIHPHKNKDPLGDAITNGLAPLGSGGSMQDARDGIADECEKLVNEFDAGGTLSNHPAAGLGYYAAGYLGDHVVVHGTCAHVPL